MAMVINMNKVPKTNNFGLFAQTATSTPVVNTTTETTILNDGVGTMTVPSNGFQIGDSFSASLSGLLSANNNNTLRIRVKAGLIELGNTGVITLPGITNKFFDLKLNFTIRAIGAVGVASIATSGQFTYSKDAGNAFEGMDFVSINNTTFDTTITNTIDITAEWGAASLANNISTELFILTKVY
jgi:hypothetical protein